MKKSEAAGNLLRDVLEGNREFLPALMDLLEEEGLTTLDDSSHGIKIGDEVFLQQMTHNYQGTVAMAWKNRVLLWPAYAVNETGPVDCLRTWKFKDQEQLPIPVIVYLQATNCYFVREKK